MIFVYDTKELAAEAEKELEAVERRRLIDAANVRLRDRKPWWHYVLPFTITITWR